MTFKEQITSLLTSVRSWSAIGAIAACIAAIPIIRACVTEKNSFSVTVGNIPLTSDTLDVHYLLPDDVLSDSTLKNFVDLPVTFSVKNDGVITDCQISLAAPTYYKNGAGVLRFFDNQNCFFKISQNNPYSTKLDCENVNGLRYDEHLEPATTIRFFLEKGNSNFPLEKAFDNFDITIKCDGKDGNESVSARYVLRMDAMFVKGDKGKINSQVVRDIAKKTNGIIISTYHQNTETTDELQAIIYRNDLILKAQ